jgi:hypothetical protein
MTQVNTNDLRGSLQNNYLLVDLNIRSWSGKRTDKDASNELLDAKHSTRDGGAFVKNLLASARTELDAVHKEAAALRHFVYQRTLPWTSSADGAKRGERLIASAVTMEFLSDLKARKATHIEAVRALRAVWPARVAQAIANLGDLGNPDDYPSEDELPSLFSIHVGMRPIPMLADFERLNIPVQLAQGLGQLHEQAARQCVQTAMDDMKDRLLSELERINLQMTKVATGEKTRLYDSLIGNMKGLVQMARNMNLTGNQKLFELADRIEMKLLQHPVEVYKNDTSKAAVLAADAKAIALDATLEEFWT